MMDVTDILAPLNEAQREAVAAPERDRQIGRSAQPETGDARPVEAVP